MRRKRVTAITIATSIRPSKPHRIVMQVGQGRSFEHDRAHDADVMRERQPFADPLRPHRHAENGNTKPDSSMLGRKNIMAIWMACSWFCANVENV